ncbi:MAG: MoaD/ThiS family protein [Ignavibacteriales bacterium]
MINVQYFGRIRQLTGKQGDEIKAGKVSEVIRQIEKLYGRNIAKEAEKCFVMVNGRNAALIKGFRTQLKSGDLVQILPPTGGG